MYTYIMTLAGISMEIRALHESTMNLCRDYITASAPELTIEMSSSDIDREREAENNTTTVFSDAYLETLALYRKIALALLPHDVLLFHGSAIKAEDGGYIFTAPSGTGKSTHAALWRQTHPGSVTMINDDKPLLRFSQTAIEVCGTPWNGKHRLGSNCSAPLAGVCLLNRGADNRIERISGREALPVLLQQTYRPESEELMQKTLELLIRLTAQTQFYSLHCNIDPSAAELSYSAMVTQGSGQ